MVKYCGHTEVKKDFSSRGRRVAWSFKKRKRGKGKCWFNLKGEGGGVCSLLILLGLCHCPRGPNTPYKSLHSKISNLLLHQHFYKQFSK